LNLPHVGHVGEVVDVDVYIFNFIKDETVDANVTLKVDNNLEIISKQSSGGSCSFNALSDKQEERSVNASTGRGTKVSFQVRAKKVGDFSLTILADGQARKNKMFYADVVEKILQIEPTGVRTFTINHETVQKSSYENFNLVIEHSTNDEDESSVCRSKTIELFTDTISKSLQHSDKYK
jgi:hypothetical protein